MKQIENISTHIQCKFTILLNCNDYMNDKLKSQPLPPNVVINPEIINKKHSTGTITQGIYSNLCYANKNYTYDFFIVLSSRNLFFRPITIDDILEVQKKFDAAHYKNPRWPFWPKMRNTALAKYYLERGSTLYRIAHEGLVFSHTVCQTIEKFMTDHPSIQNDTFKFPAFLEEFALQTIAINESTVCPFVYIGRGANETLLKPPTNDTIHFVYKTIRSE